MKMSTGKFEAALAKVRAAKEACTSHTSSFRKAQNKLKEERNKLCFEAIEAAQTTDEVWEVVELGLSDNTFYRTAYERIATLATTLDELEPLEGRGGDIAKEKMHKFSMEKIEGITTRDELLAVVREVSGPAPQIVIEKLTEPIKRCESLEELSAFKKYKSSHWSMDIAYKETCDRLYEEKHGTKPIY
jgi:hypothetical protein